MNKVNFKLEHSSNIAGLTGLVQEGEKTVPHFQKCSNLYISLIDLIALKLTFHVNYDLANRFQRFQGPLCVSALSQRMAYLNSWMYVLKYNLYTLIIM